MSAGRRRALWPWIVLPFFLVAAAVLYLWIAGEGGLSDAGGYRVF